MFPIGGSVKVGGARSPVTIVETVKRAFNERKEESAAEIEAGSGGKGLLPPDVLVTRSDGTCEGGIASEPLISCDGSAQGR